MSALTAVDGGPELVTAHRGELEGARRLGLDSVEALTEAPES